MSRLIGVLVLVLFPGCMLGQEAEPPAEPQEPDTSAANERRNPEPASIKLEVVEDLPQLQQALNELSSPHYPVRSRAVEVLKSGGYAALPLLERAIHHTDPEIGYMARRLLVEMRGGGFIGVNLSDPYLLERGDDEDLDLDAQKKRVNGFHPVRYVSMTTIPNIHQTGVLGNWPPNLKLPAEVAGIESGDLLLSIGGKPITGTTGVIREVAILGPGKETVLQIERNGVKLNLPVILARHPNSTFLVDIVPAQKILPTQRSTVLGDESIIFEE